MNHRWLAWIGFVVWVPLPLFLLYKSSFIYLIVSSTISCSLLVIGKMIQEEMNNAIFHGNDRTILTSVLKRAQVLGDVFGIRISIVCRRFGYNFGLLF